MELAIEIVKPSFKIVYPTSEDGFLELSKLIEYCGRLSHKSEDCITEVSHGPFIEKIARKLGHESIEEHASITVHFMMSRAASHQLVRHRLCAYCVTGDSRLVAFSETARSPKRWTIEQLYQWQDDPKRKGRLQLIRLRSVDDNNLIVPGRIGKIVDTGLQHVFEVKTRCGRALRCTDNEWFKTNSGWHQLNELRVGDRVQVNGDFAYRNEEWLRHHYLDLNMERQAVAKLAGVSDSHLGKWIKKFGLQKQKPMYPNRQPGHGVLGMHGADGRAQIAERMRGEQNHRWLGTAAGAMAGRARAQGSYVLSTCDCCDNPATHRHHVDGNTLNNSATNVVPLCDVCHAAHHIGQAVLSTYSTPIISILAAGIERTYDIEMATDDEAHRNYVVNGFIVHNTQESQRYCDYSHPKYGSCLKVICPPMIADVPDGLVIQATWEEGNEDVVYRAVAGDVVSPNWYGAPRFRNFVHTTMRCYGNYLWERDQGVPAEDARYLLPNATKTEIAMSANVRQWRHVGRLRCDTHAQWEIRGIMQGVIRELATLMPASFNDIGT